MVKMHEEDFCILCGKTIEKIIGGVDDEQMEFYTDDGDIYYLIHIQDCCEQVTIEDICGDIDDLIGTPILLSEEVTNSPDPEPPLPDPEYPPESYTWTFYKLATIKGAVTIRWFGESNGYYSEQVDFMKVDKGETK